MIILDINKLSLNFGYGKLFEDLSFTLNEGDSISIVGPNGCGKSSLLKIIAGKIKGDSGSVNISKDASVAYLDQTASDKLDSRNVRDTLKDAFPHLEEMRKRLKKYEDILSDTTRSGEHEKVLSSYCLLIEEFSRKGGYDIDVAINTVCSGLKIMDKLDQEYSTLSGGEKTLVELAKVLLQKPKLLLLDEPTNHLDINRIEWLESYIKSFKGASVIVSHDRYFLDKMSTKIIDLSGLTAKVYNTNYSGYLKERDKEFEKAMADYKDQQIVIKRLQEQIKYFSTMGMAKNSSTLCDRAHALQTQLDRLLAKKIERPKEDNKVKLKFNEDAKSSKRIFEARNFSVILPSGKTILNNINFIITAGERIALIGANGSGKSTFVKSLLGKSELNSEGEIFVGPSVKVGYLPQTINFKNEKDKVLDCFIEEISIHEEKARRILANFYFSNADINKLVKNLSGGEKIRLKLAILLQQQVNCLVFDEPTNHIDLQTKEAVEKAIEDFEGTILFVSHDRYFINNFADKVIEFDNGKITTYYGNYDYYKNRKG